jgi:ring-1,2-phenylacetyl-CoA epoxidase subunit PaaC
LAQLASKIRGELRYHTLHANTWIKKLGAATEESIDRMQHSLDYAMPYALGIFEPSVFEEELMEEGIFEGEQATKAKWLTRVEEIISLTQLHMPDIKLIQPVFGGRIGNHSKHLQPLLDEMGEVFRIDPQAEW